jgi:hypothetical protein
MLRGTSLDHIKDTDYYGSKLEYVWHGRVSQVKPMQCAFTRIPPEITLTGNK